jgi:hypothetical protein
MTPENRPPIVHARVDVCGLILNACRSRILAPALTSQAGEVTCRTCLVQLAKLRVDLERRARWARMRLGVPEPAPAPMARPYPPLRVVGGR